MEGGEFKVTGTITQQNQEKTKKVGHSKFYNVGCVVTSEKQDIMKPEDYLEEGIL